MGPGEQKMKLGPDALGTAENEPDPQNIKTGPDARWYRRKLVRER
jgi:hypothetical protein